MAVTVTEKAARHIRRALDQRGKGLGLRLGVKTSGCSGLAYAIEFADEARGEDVTFEAHGVTLVVDRKSLIVLEGTELDFVREGLNEGFRFSNPNAKSTCGCGESFTV